MGPCIFNETPSLGDNQPRLKSKWPVHEIEKITHKASNLYIKKGLWITKIVQLKNSILNKNTIKKYVVFYFVHFTQYLLNSCSVWKNNENNSLLGQWMTLDEV